MNKYLITLKPVENYFFGGETTFGGKNGKNETNYFARSNPFPQQTSLLGLLRHLLLISNDAIPIYSYKNKANKLIGEKSFDINVRAKEQKFGVIRQISPLYILDKLNKKVFRITLPYENFAIEFHTGEIVLNKLMNQIPIVLGYDPKSHYQSVFKDNTGNILQFDEVFTEIKPKIGIDKERDDDDKEKLYKQITYTLKDNFAFAYFAHIDETYQNDNNNQQTKLNSFGQINFGGERKLFNYQIIKSDKQEFIAEPDFNKGKEKIVLTSDTLVDESILDEVRLMLNQTQDFRTVKLPASNGKFEVSKKLNLLKKGTVIFADDLQKIEELINQAKNYKNIGFNHYIKL